MRFYKCIPTSSISVVSTALLECWLVIMLLSNLKEPVLGSQVGILACLRANFDEQGDICSAFLCRFAIYYEGVTALPSSGL